jgi:hypothetical protein
MIHDLNNYVNCLPGFCMFKLSREKSHEQDLHKARDKRRGNATAQK